MTEDRDLVARLKYYAADHPPFLGGPYPNAKLMGEAAEEIERLRYLNGVGIWGLDAVDLYLRTGAEPSIRRSLLACVQSALAALRGQPFPHQQPPVPEVPCCTVNNCVGVQRAKQGEGCPACPSRPKEER